MECSRLTWCAFGGVVWCSGMGGACRGACRGGVRVVVCALAVSVGLVSGGMVRTARLLLLAAL